MRMLVRPHGLRPLSTADRSPVAKPDHRVVAIERRHHNLADFSLRHRIARARPHDLDDDAFVDDHALKRRTLYRR